MRKQGDRAYVITKDGCPYCEKLKQELVKRGIEYTEVTKDDARYFREEWKTVPQMWLNGEYVGGYSDFVNSTVGEAVKEKEEGCLACEA